MANFKIKVSHGRPRLGVGGCLLSERYSQQDIFFYFYFNNSYDGILTVYTRVPVEDSCFEGGGDGWWGIWLHERSDGKLQPWHVVHQIKRNFIVKSGNIFKNQFDCYEEVETGKRAKWAQDQPEVKSRGQQMEKTNPPRQKGLATQTALPGFILLYDNGTSTIFYR